MDDDNSKEWTLYDAGPKTVKCPLICLPPASGTGDVFFRQILGLTSAGYRVIAVSFVTKTFHWFHFLCSITFYVYMYISIFMTLFRDGNLPAFIRIPAF